MIKEQSIATSGHTYAVHENCEIDLNTFTSASLFISYIHLLPSCSDPTYSIINL